MFNMIPSITNRRISGSFENIECLVNYIKDSNRSEIPDILRARTFGKGSNEYDEIKRNDIPCVVINFNHNTYVNSSTIINPTGYLYLDIDNQDELGCINFDYISAYWRSLSNTGYSILIKVNTLNSNLLRESYNYVGEELDLKFDSGAISKDRLTVLSYDPDVYYNSDARELDLSILNTTHYNNTSSHFSFVSKCNGLIFDNLNEKVSNLNIDYNQDGIYDFGKNNKLKYSKVYPPLSITKGRRNTVLSTIAHNLIALNKNAKDNLLFNYLNSVNLSRCKPPIDQRELKNLFNNKYNKKESLVLIENEERRFLFNPYFKLDAHQKRSLCIRRINKERVEKSKEKIRNSLKNWNYETFPKITIENISKATQMNRKTIQKYYKDIKGELGLK